MRSKFLVTTTILASLAASIAIPAAPARAENGQVALGVVGGLAAGALLGSALSRPARPPAVVYEEPAYYAPPRPRCWREEQPLYDQWGHVAEMRQVRVCR